MSQPTAYNPAHEFLADEAALAALPGTELDIEFNAIELTLDEILTNLALIQRDDGDLANESVHYDTLDDELRLGVFYPLTAWATDTAYAERALVVYDFAIYRCLVSHTSTTFSVNLNAGKWVLVTRLPAGDVSGRYDMAMSVSGVPLAGEELFFHVFTASIKFEASLSGSVAKANVAATAEAVFSIKKNGVEFATLTFAAAGTTGSFVAASATTFTIGDVLTVIAPASQDATLAGIAITLAGARA